MIQSLSQNRRFKIKTILLGIFITFTLSGYASTIDSPTVTSPIKQVDVEPEEDLSDEERELLKVYLSLDNFNKKEMATRDISRGITSALATFDLGLSASIIGLINYNTGDSFPIVTCLAPTTTKTVRKKETGTGREYTAEESDTPEIRISLDTVKLVNGQTEFGLWRYDGVDEMIRVAGTQINNKVAYHWHDVVVLDGNTNTITIIDDDYYDEKDEKYKLVYECKEDISHITSVAGMRYDTKSNKL